MPFVSLVAAVVFVVWAALAYAQAEVSDAQLEAASVGRVVRVGPAAGGRGTVVTLPLEVYVARVLAGEGEPRAAEAAQQALAIAIRTFAMANLGRHERDGFDLCDTTHCQVIRAATAPSRQAALATAGQVLTYEGAPAELFYSASCGGRSEAGTAVWPKMPDYPYLRPVRDHVHEDDKPWDVELSTQQIQQALRKAGFEGTRLTDVSVERRTPSGRAGTLHLSGLRPDEIAGEDFRAAIGATELRSTAFTVKKTSQGFRFTGTGFGHGVGMCVIGAGRLAARGESAATILDLYFHGLTLTRFTGSDPRGPVSGSDPPLGGAGSDPRVVMRGSDPRIVMRGSDPSAAIIEKLAQAAHAELGRSLGSSVAPIAIALHDSIESFRRATGRPWWVSSVVNGTTIDMAPATVLAQRDGLETSVRVGIAEALIGDTFNGRPLWIRVGAARHFARGGRSPSPTLPSKAQCPSDAELTLAVSASAQREAEMRAEACFARARAKQADWRRVR